MVTANKFDKLPTKIKANLVFKQGHLLKREVRFSKVLMLYRLQNMYVEVCLSSDESRVIEVEVISDNIALYYYYPMEESVSLSTPVSAYN